MQLSDIDDVLAIDAASFSSHQATEANLREELERPWSRTWVARRGDKLAAFIIVWHVVDELHVLNIATDPALRRQGYARALMEHTLAYARKADARMIMLEVRRGNRAAIGLYRGLGFFAMGIRPAYYSDGEDAIEMLLLFDPDTKDIIHRTDEVRIS